MRAAGMNAREVAEFNGRLAMALKDARAVGAVGTDDELSIAIQLKHGAGDIDIRAVLTRLRRSTARRAKPGEKVRHGFFT